MIGRTSTISKGRGLKKYEFFPLFYIKHFEICPELCIFAIEIRLLLPAAVYQSGEVGGARIGDHLRRDTGGIRWPTLCG